MARASVDTVRGADAAARLATGGRDLARLAHEHGGRIGSAVATKLNPVLTVTSAATTVYESGKALANAENLSTAVSNIATSGFPATSGILPAAVCTAATSVPLPGAMPRAWGIVQSMFVATHGMPDFSA